MCLLVAFVMFWNQSTQTQDFLSPEPATSLLIKAIRKRDLPEIQRLIKPGANLDFKEPRTGATALTESIAENLPNVAAQLILSMANPNVADNQGVSALMYAAWYCQPELVQLLLKHGAAVDARDGNGETALMNAAYSCADGTIVRLLLASGASVKVTDKQGDTALTEAAWRGNESAVRELVAAGADLNAKTDEGETALTLARDREVGRKKSHDRIYAFLRAAAKRSRK